jgi:hypothetical protein
MCSSVTRHPHFTGALLYAPVAFPHKVQVSMDPNVYNTMRFLYMMLMSAHVSYLTRPVLPGVWSTESNWMGYMDVVTDRGVVTLGRWDIVVA